ncbi:glutamate-cysteine ligase family protein [Streptomyces sp. NPDC059373]
MCAARRRSPLLVAIGANSPMWRGRDTGFASWRTVLFGHWPVSGGQPVFRNARDYDRRADQLVDGGAITARRHPATCRSGTVPVRVRHLGTPHERNPPPYCGRDPGQDQAGGADGHYSGAPPGKEMTSSC